jgi:hypothetical protein
VPIQHPLEGETNNATCKVLQDGNVGVTFGVPNQISFHHFIQADLGPAGTDSLGGHWDGQNVWKFAAEVMQCGEEREDVREVNGAGCGLD